MKLHFWVLIKKILIPWRLSITNTNWDPPSTRNRLNVTNRENQFHVLFHRWNNTCEMKSVEINKNHPMSLNARYDLYCFTYSILVCFMYKHIFLFFSQAKHYLTFHLMKQHCMFQLWNNTYKFTLRFLTFRRFLFDLMCPLEIGKQFFSSWLYSVYLLSTRHKKLAVILFSSYN